MDITEDNVSAIHIVHVKNVVEQEDLFKAMVDSDATNFIDFHFII